VLCTPHLNTLVYIQLKSITLRLLKGWTEMHCFWKEPKGHRTEERNLNSLFSRSLPAILLPLFQSLLCETPPDSELRLKQQLYRKLRSLASTATVGFPLCRDLSMCGTAFNQPSGITVFTGVSRMRSRYKADVYCFYSISLGVD